MALIKTLNMSSFRIICLLFFFLSSIPSPLLFFIPRPPSLIVPYLYFLRLTLYLLSGKGAA